VHKVKVSITIISAKEEAGSIQLIYSKVLKAPTALNQIRHAIKDFSPTIV